jgi:putative hydrolase of the HAD superfamily
VIFDLFGTLVLPFAGPRHGVLMREMSAALGVPAEAFEEAWGSAYEARRIGLATVPDQLRDICRLLGCDEIPEVRIDEVVELRMGFFRSSLVPRSGALSVLEELRANGPKLGLVSDTSSETALIWPTTPLASLFDVAVFSCVAGCHKPDPQIYRAVWEPLGVDPARCLYVGDGMSEELSGATALGMQAVLLSIADERDLEPGKEPWEGQTISSLSDVLSLAVDGRSTDTR